jgi:hypothetical protein
VDSRFRGNDCGLQCPCLANDTSTRRRVAPSSSRHSSLVAKARLPMPESEGRGFNLNESWSGEVNTNEDDHLVTLLAFTGVRAIGLDRKGNSWVFSVNRSFAYPAPASFRK